jgi:hypothetical protein
MSGRPPAILNRRDDSNGEDRFTVHPKADVAAFFLSIPKPSHSKRALNTNWIATDDVLKELEIHPGDELLSLRIAAWSRSQ